MEGGGGGAGSSWFPHPMKLIQCYIYVLWNLCVVQAYGCMYNNIIMHSSDN